MCIAIYQPAGCEIQESQLRNCWKNNDDGAGFAYHHEGKLYIQKGFMHYKDFLVAYNKARSEYKDSKFIIHFRIGTCGLRNAANTHPFAINENLAYIHNGIIACYRPDNENDSDTAYFAKHILAYWPKNFHLNKECLQSLKDIIGGSKLVFLDNLGNHSIVNEGHGEWDHGCWFSNSSHRQQVIFRPTYTHSSWNDFYDSDHKDFPLGRYNNTNKDIYKVCATCNAGIIVDANDPKDMVHYCYPCWNRFAASRNAYFLCECCGETLGAKHYDSWPLCNQCVQNMNGEEWDKLMQCEQCSRIFYSIRPELLLMEPTYCPNCYCEMLKTRKNGYHMLCLNCEDRIYVDYQGYCYQCDYFIRAYNKLRAKCTLCGEYEYNTNRAVTLMVNNIEATICKICSYRSLSPNHRLFSHYVMAGQILRPSHNSAAQEALNESIKKTKEQDLTRD